MGLKEDAEEYKIWISENKESLRGACNKTVMDTLRCALTHLVALGCYRLDELKERIAEEDVGKRTALTTILGDIGERELDGCYSLKLHVWAEVDDMYSGFSEGERKQVLRKRIAARRSLQRESRMLEWGEVDIDPMKLNKAIEGFKITVGEEAKFKVECERDLERGKRYLKRLQELYNDLSSPTACWEKRTNILEREIEKAPSARQRRELKGKLRTFHKKNSERYTRCIEAREILKEWIQNIEQAMSSYEIYRRGQQGECRGVNHSGAGKRDWDQRSIWEWLESGRQ